MPEFLFIVILILNAYFVKKYATNIACKKLYNQLIEYIKINEQEFIQQILERDMFIYHLFKVPKEYMKL